MAIQHERGIRRNMRADIIANLRKGNLFDFLAQNGHYVPKDDLKVLAMELSYGLHVVMQRDETLYNRAVNAVEENLKNRWS